MKSKKRFIFLVALFSLICISAVAAQYYYGYRGYGYGGWDWFNLAQLYDEYHQWFDFAIFLAIFLGLGKEVFGEHFKGGARGVYVGVGFMLAFALVWFEEETGFTIIKSLGLYVLVLFGLIFLFIVFGWLKKITKSGVLALSVAYLLFYAAFKFALQQYFYEYFYNVSFYVRNIDTLALITNGLAVAAGFGFLYGLWQIFQKEEK